MWTLAAILTSTNVFPEGSKLRTDAKMYAVDQSHWFFFPYPGKFKIPLKLMHLTVIFTFNDDYYDEGILIIMVIIIIIMIIIIIIIIIIENYLYTYFIYYYHHHHHYHWYFDRLRNYHHTLLI